MFLKGSVSLKEIKRNKINKFIIVVAMLFVTMIFIDTNQAYGAAKDTTKPKITLKSSNTKPSTSSIKVNVTASDASGIKTMKWASGSRKTSYFKKSGSKITLDKKGKASVTISKNGIYTFYSSDKAGNETVKSITITNIDKAKATVSISQNIKEDTNSNVKLTLTIKESGLGIKNIKYLTGKKSEKDFKEDTRELSFKVKSETDLKYDNTFSYTATLTVKSNNVYTFLVEDLAGNKTLKRITISNIDKTEPSLTTKLSTTKPTNGSVKISITTSDKESGMKEAMYMSGKKKSEDFIEGKSTLIKLNDSDKGSFKVKKNGNYTVLVRDNAGNEAIKVVSVKNIDTEAPIAYLNYSVMNQAATVVVDAWDEGEGIGSIKFLKGNVTKFDDERWETKAKEVKDGSFKVTSSGKYSVLVEDLAGNQTIESIDIELELRAVWISYLEFANYGRNGFTDESFQSTIDTMFDNVVSLNMNAVVVQVRPFGDAMYESKYFPWSRYISGTQGKDPGLSFDPLEYMVEAAHERGLAFHAWLNPYRVTTASTDYSKLSEDNPARVWYEDDDDTNDRNVLEFGGNLYYNPSVKEVQTLIINGIKEIVNNYDVDGIHFDDYFYPALGSKYASIFDNVEYEDYAATTKASGKTVLHIADWRRNNVNTLIKNVYSSIKKIDETVEFGISPGGFYDSLTSNLGYYVDYKTWLSKDGYIDYICPQIYWSFSHGTYPYAKTLDKWLSFRTSETVKVYIGIANYKAGSNLEPEWKNDPDVLKKQIEYGRDTGLVDGFMFFRYDFFYNKVTKPAVDRLLDIL